MPRILALLLLSSTCALAEEQESAGKFYFTANLGGSVAQDTTIKSTDAFITSGTIQFSAGGRLDVGFGYYITDWLSAELETGFLINLTKLEDELSSGDVAYYQIPILANLIYHIPTRSRFHPFIGAGFGGVESQLVNNDWISGRSADDFGLAWQGMAGCRYQLSSKIDLGVAYKYLGTSDRTFDSFVITMKGTQTHSSTASFSMKF